MLHHRDVTSFVRPFLAAHVRDVAPLGAGIEKLRALVLRDSLIKDERDHAVLPKDRIGLRRGFCRVLINHYVIEADETGLIRVGQAQGKREKDQHRPVLMRKSLLIKAKASSCLRSRASSRRRCGSPLSYSSPVRADCRRGWSSPGGRGSRRRPGLKRRAAA